MTGSILNKRHEISSKLKGLIGSFTYIREYSRDEHINNNAGKLRFELDETKQWHYHVNGIPLRVRSIRSINGNSLEINLDYQTKGVNK